MKKMKVLAAVIAMGLLAAGCGQSAEQETAPMESIEETAEQETIEIETEETEETTAQEENLPEETEEASEAKETQPAQTQQETGAQTEAQSAENEAAAGGYEDNFAVDSAAAAEFAGKIKTAVAEKNLEKLADLTAFPVYVGFKDGGTPVESRDEFLALGADKIFTQELVDSVAAADENALSPSMAGFVLSDGSKANIIFAVNEGELTIVGINY
ncbi:MAG TPA: hypothetical protein H9704_00730 [Candidatus Enterocloster excrementipullorum]|uniref:Lipoprotein n=1 Tax=Candidatus Enterocloster excrementipullorum TaxID=2838559 RepID=A0A9D2MYC0_9FIRM|nr:hypothetical protein [Candidatus Enterocloster excrementipullorum]